MNTDALALFLPPVQRWFRTALGEPTVAQRLGWPAIAAGQHTLILAPTGSGKTLGVSGVSRCTVAATGIAARCACTVHLAAQGAQQRHSSQFADSSRRCGADVA